MQAIFMNSVQFSRLEQRCRPGMTNMFTDTMVTLPVMQIPVFLIYCIVLFSVLKSCCQPFFLLQYYKGT